jgi:hypothetical protein
MKKFLFGIALAAVFAVAQASADVIVYYNFNAATTTANTGSAISTLSNFNPASAALTFPTGSTLNAEGADIAGNAVSQNNWNNAGSPAYFQFTLDATGYTDLIVSFWEQKSSTGPSPVDFLYSDDGGSSFTSFASLTASNAPGNLHSVDLTSVTALNGQSDLVFRIRAGNASSASGTFRIDNLKVDATIIPEPSTMMLVGAGLVGVWMLRRRS